VRQQLVWHILRSLSDTPSNAAAHGRTVAEPNKPAIACALWLANIYANHDALTPAVVIS
jgi:hypothetical protein